MFPDTICYKNPCSNPGFKAKKNLTIKIWEIRLIRNSYSLSINYVPICICNFAFVIFSFFKNHALVFTMSALYLLVFNLIMKYTL